MCVSELLIYRETRGSPRDNMALERSALARPLISTMKRRIRTRNRRMTCRARGAIFGHCRSAKDTIVYCANKYGSRVT